MIQTASCLLYHSLPSKSDALNKVMDLARQVPGIQPATLVACTTHHDRLAFRVVRNDSAASVEVAISNEHTNFTVSADPEKSDEGVADLISDIIAFIKNRGGALFSAVARVFEQQPADTGLVPA